MSAARIAKCQLEVVQRAHCTHNVTLQGDILLPRLEGLSFTFSWHNQTNLILSWLKRQPCKRLKLTVTLAIAKLPRDRQLMELLRELHLSKLSLIAGRQFLVELQQLWSSLSLHDMDVNFTGGFSQSFRPLQALPHSRGKAAIRFSVTESGQIDVSWSALASHANVVLEMDVSEHLAGSSELHILGATLTAPEHLQQPWQLTVRQASSVHGLPASQPTSSSYFLQNAAAKAHGWVEPSD